MQIVCLVKQVPRPDAIEFDPDTRTLRREGVPLLLNPFDATAVAEAVALREAVGGEVIAMTMGPPQAEGALRTCLALGADRCVHLSNRIFAVADTLGTSRTVGLAIGEEGGVDLVLTGRKTVDSETWQVPPEVAALLGWPHVTNVVDLEAQGNVVQAMRETEAGYETYELETHAVISVAVAREEDGEADGRGRVDVRAVTDLVDRREEPGQIERFELEPLPTPRMRLVETRSAPAFDLDEEDVVVLLGPDAPPTYSPDGLAVAGTRESCADGRVPRNRHVGLYGRPVAPRVLVAVGVPGDFEHLTGIVKSAVVVAVAGGAETAQRADVIFRGDPDEVIRPLPNKR
jgi:electron transfer flavoprotein alpha/beta subunit